METHSFSRVVIVTTVNHTKAVPIISSTSRNSTDGEFVGFGVELLDLVCSNAGLNYRIKFAKDPTTGRLIDPATSKWDGMMGEVVEKRADLVVAAMAMDAQRSQYVDFSIPFKQLGIAILHVAPTPQPPPFFACFHILSLNAWACTGALLVLFTFALWLLAKVKISRQWNYYPHTKGKRRGGMEKTTAANAFWFCVAAILRQAFPAPDAATSIKLAASIWWLFTLVLSTVFTANFTTYLALPIHDFPIRGFEDLVRQTKVKYGFHSTGSIGLFFKDSPLELYRKVWKNVEKFNETERVLLPGNTIGVEKVLEKNGSFAFIMDTPPLDHALARHCELNQAGGIANRKWWAIPTQKGSDLRDRFNVEIIRLMEKGILNYLDRKWLHRGRAKLCKFNPEDAIQTLELGNVGGVFFLHGTMSIFAALVAIAEKFNARLGRLHSGT